MPVGSPHTHGKHDADDCGSGTEQSESPTHRRRCDDDRNGRIGRFVQPWITQRVAEVVGRLVPVDGRLGHRAHHCLLQLHGHRFAHGAQAGHRIHEVTSHHRARGGTRERRGTHQHLVKHAGQAVDIAATIQQCVAGRLFRTHVVGSADREAGLGEPRACAALDGACDAEIRQQSSPVRQQDVCRLDVAMHEAMAVCIREPFRDLAGDLDCDQHRQRTGARKALLQRLAIHEGHDVERHAFRHARVQHSHDAGVLELCGNAHFARKSLRTKLRDELRVRRLDRDRRIGDEVGCEVNRGHAAVTDLSFDAIAASECSGKHPNSIRCRNAWGIRCRHAGNLTVISARPA